MIVSTLITGLALGSMYGLLALGFHVTYAVSKTVNFSQGASMMVGAVLGYTFAVTFGWPTIPAIVAALLGCAALGLVVERVLVRPFASRGSDLWLMATIAGGLILENAVLFTFGKEPRSLPSPLASEAISVFGTGAYPLQLIIPVVGLLIAGLLALVQRRTKLGKAMLAAVQRPEAAELVGVDTRAMIAASYAISTVFAGVAGLLIAPLFNVSASMGTIFGIKAFATAIIGGISSAWGVMLAGLLYGCVEALTTAYLGSSYTQIVSFSMVILVLVWVPNGLFGRAEVKKV
ncbi:branched-chain amino acid ABC transporter permease [Acuticoccus mangrovi]|uniref:Branched-chain amino acid ABC transporter permease n=1 Tax=Acuticoccus mangrovi TaxID=2796142 RepID=A0A934ISB3_9HYPH|nr:branched-chain amino acid ABC transporter permease [Acuticoccus mangrovi]MBJ3777785.1 branched-chain amino acid ABC transporter permease [Acuticoccus mangrovi]